RVRARRDPLRVSDREAAVLGRHGAPDPRAGAVAGAGAAAAPPDARAARFVDDLPEMPGEAARPALPRRRRAGRRPRPLPQRRAHTGAARRRARTFVGLGPTPARIG